MDKTSTFVFSVHDLASKATYDLVDTAELNIEDCYQDVFQIIENSSLYDVDQKVVDRILKMA